jgi:hypothetical protein
MNFIYLVLQVYLGLVFFWVYEAHKYIISGAFDFAKWKIENMAIFIWTATLCAFLSTILYIEPGNVGYVLKLMGLNLAEQLEGGTFTLSGVLLGILVGYATRRLIKAKK